MAVLKPIQVMALRRAGRPRELTSIWVTSRESFWIAVEALRAHKLRSFLTLLGIVIATTTLIVVMSVVNGMNLYISDHIANLGANVFIVHQFQWAQGFEYWLKARRRNQPIRIEDYEFLKENVQGHKSIGAVAWIGFPRPDVRYKGHALYEVGVRGVTPSMADIGQDLVNEFFSTLDPLDKEIEIGGRPFRVIGTAKKIGSTFGQSQDNFALIPLTTFRKVYQARPQLMVDVQAWDGRQMLALEDEVRSLMRARRHLPYNENDNFGINASDTIMSAWERLTGSIFAVTIAVVAVFMVVGGIVIMNIMLASVTERTHEIGIRKSLGARRRDILTQFVIESGVMAGVGGVLGILLAVGISHVVEIFWTSSVPLNGVLIGLVLSTAVGLFFGIYPAYQAAKLDPIEALRTEN